MTTLANVRKQALQMLNRVGSGQSVDSDDDTIMTASYDEIYADLKEDGLATWTSTAEVPAALTPHVVALVAYNRLGLFKTTDAERAAIVTQKAANARREIRRIINPPYESLEEPEDF